MVELEWTAPAVKRVRPPNVAAERAALEGWLDYQRQTLLDKCSGLTVEQLRRRSVPPSSLSLLGLVRHLTGVERAWFRIRLGGLPPEQFYSADDDPEGDFNDVDTADAEADFAAYRAELELVREATAGRDLDDRFQGRLHELDLRWAMVHMIEEYARHNGHADLLRERIDGVTGD
jgi:uncharacterized damage-inducible protein DinB